MHLREVGCEDRNVVASNTSSCPVAGFAINGVEPSGSATIVFVGWLVCICGM